MRELADTLERNLNFGSAVKKPAGGVSLHFQGTGDARSQPQQMSGQRSSKQVWDMSHFFFSLISLIFFAHISFQLHYTDYYNPLGLPVVGMNALNILFPDNL